jgi:hypothetical protein
MVRAITRHAEREADLTAAFLRATGLYQSEPPKLPAAFLLELGAMLELGFWEREGLRRHLDVDLPTCREAAEQLAARCRKGPKEFDDPDAAPLSLQVLRVWTEHFAWDGPELLDAEVVLGDANEDDLIDILAEFVWTNRHRLEQLIPGEEK